jgi:WD40 repeat protein
MSIEQRPTARATPEAILSEEVLARRRCRPELPPSPPVHDLNPDGSSTTSSSQLGQPPEVPDHTLLRLIGRGSYGEVWLALNVTGAYRAVKVVYQSRFEDSRPFDREFNGILCYEPISRSHDSQVDILHVGRNDATGCFYYIMELADDQEAGQQIDPAQYRPRTLRSDLQKRRQLPFDDCLQISLALTTALGHLHRCGLVHRDVKPSNIVFINGIPKLADVGLITSADETRSFVGTEGFLPPEGPGLPQADLYALGKVIYEMCMGRDRKEFPELPTNLRELPDQKKILELNEIVTKACHPDQQHRYHRAEEMHADLALLQGGKSVIGARNLERRLLLARRFGRVLILLVLTALAGSYHMLQTKQKIAQQLIRFQLAQGIQLMEEDRFTESLPWFTEALSLGPADADLHRMRLSMILNQCPRLIQLLPHRRPVNDLEFSPDGKLVATASDDGTARVWNLNSGAARTPWLRHLSEVHSIRFSPDGKLVVTAGSDGTARIWDLDTDSNPVPPLRHEQSVQEACFSPDGKLILTACLDGAARIWDAATGKLLGIPLAHKEPVWHARFSPDGSRILTLSGESEPDQFEGQVHLWRLTADKTYEPLTIPHPRALTAVFSPDGSKLATAGNDQTARIWSAIDGKLLGEPLLHRGSVIEIDFSPDGSRLVSACADQTVRVWDIELSQPVGPVLRRNGPVNHVRFSPDGRWIVTAGEDRCVRVFNATTGETLISALTHGGQVGQVTFDQDGFLLATSSSDSLVRIWKLAANRPAQIMSDHANRIYAAVLSPDGRFAVTAYGPLKGPNRLRVWNVLTGHQLHDWIAHDAKITSLSLSTDGKILVSASQDQTVRCWDPMRGEPLLGPLTHKGPVSHMATAPNGNLIATAFGFPGSPGNVLVWDAHSGKTVAGPLLHENEIMSLEFSPDSKSLVVASGTARAPADARIWNLEAQKLAVPRLKHAAPVNWATFSADGLKVATASQDQSARVWNVITGSSISPPIKHAGPVQRVIFSPDGKHIATASDDKTVRLWDIFTGDPVTPPLPHQASVNLIAFSRDGRLLISASVDGVARVWSAQTGEALTPALRHQALIVQAVFSADNQFVLTASQDQTARIWPLTRDNRPVPDLQAMAHLLSGHTMHSTGGLVPLKPNAIWVTQKRLQAKYPREFLLGTNEVVEWHLRQADSADKLQDWDVASFHIERCLQRQPKDAQLIKRWERIRSMMP